MNKINSKLKNEAISLGLCDKWQNDWIKDKSEQELIDMYKKGIDFCFESKYPSNDFIKENISKDVLSENNIFIDEEFYKVNPENDCVILGNSKGKLVFDGFSIRDIYIDGDSDVEIEATDFSKVFVNVYNDTHVVITQKKCAAIHVYIHGTGKVTYK